VLTDDQTAQLRHALREDRARIIDKARQALGFAMSRAPGTVGRDSIDASVEEGIYSTELRLHDREKHLLAKIDKALERIEHGELDECEDCGDPIGFKRLLARPVTTLCVECKQDREDKENATGPVPRADILPPKTRAR